MWVLACFMGRIGLNVMQEDAMRVFLQASIGPLVTVDRLYELGFDLEKDYRAKVRWFSLPFLHKMPIRL